MGGRQRLRLHNATNDIQGLVRAGCEVNYDRACNMRTSTQCKSPLLKRLGIVSTKEGKELGYTALAIALIVGSTPTLNKLVSLTGIDLDTATADVNPCSLRCSLGG